MMWASGVVWPEHSVERSMFARIRYQQLGALADGARPVTSIINSHFEW